MVCADIFRWKSREGTNGLKGHIDSYKGSRGGERQLTEMISLQDEPRVNIEESGTGTSHTISSEDKYILQTATYWRCDRHYVYNRHPVSITNN